MRRRRLRPFGLVLAAALALAVVIPGTALASFGALSYPVHGPVNARVNGETTVTVRCPAGSHVLGGGQYVLAGDQNSFIHSSAPFDGGDADAMPDDGWRSRVDSINGASNTVTEYAICTTTQPVYRGKGGTLHSPTHVLLRASCPSGDAAVGGGLDISAKFNSAYVTASTPGPGASWDAHGWAGLGATNQKVTDWVICADAQVTYRSVSRVIAGGSFTSASAPCPAAAHVVGGGVRAPDVGIADRDIDIRPTIFSPFDGSDGNSVPDDGWQIEADDWGAGQNLMVESTAICLS